MATFPIWETKSIQYTSECIGCEYNRYFKCSLDGSRYLHVSREEKEKLCLPKIKREDGR